MSPLSTEVYEFNADRGRWAMFVDGIGDLRLGAVLWRTWATLGYRDFLRATRGTMLGPLWSILGTGLTVAGLGYVYGAAFNMHARSAYPYIAGGLVLWFFISGCINGGLSVYRNAGGVLKERTLPISFPAFRYVFRLSVELLIKFTIFAAAALYAGLPIGWTALLAIPGLVVLLLNGIWVVLLLGPLGARFQDIDQIIGPLMLIAFLASPVLWPHTILGNDGWIVQINPFAHFIAIVRDPLLGSPAPELSVTIALAITGAGWIAAMIMHCLTKSRLVFWI